MKIEKVAEMTEVNRFLYWIKERHKIYLKRLKGEKKPWTDDEVLQNYFFTNPYRENDKVSIWFRENVREPLRNDEEVLMATVIFRWFNRITTGEMLLKHNLLQRWQVNKAIKALRELAKSLPVFTGAYMIKAGNGPPGCKIPNVCNAIQNIWGDRKNLIDKIEDSPSLEIAHRAFMEYPYLGGFMAYEIVTDLRHTYLLEDADDIMTWANPGPGCMRGLIRLQTGTLPLQYKKPKDVLETMRKLLIIVNRRLKGMPPFEMREIEHSLCEWDKYERALNQSGRLKRRYKGV